MDIEKQVEKLEAERAAIERRLANREAANRKDRGRQYTIDETLHRLRLKALIDVADGVQLRNDWSIDADDPLAPLNEAMGTMIDVRRTNGTIDFGEHGTHNLPLQSVIPATDQKSRTSGKPLVGW